MSSYEVSEPIINPPYEKPSRYWYIREGEEPQRRQGRRPPIIFRPRDQKEPWTLDEKILRPSKEYPAGYELALVSLIRERLEAWQKAGCPGVTRTTLELIQWWTREGREKRLFYAQLEAALTIIRSHVNYVVPDTLRWEQCAAYYIDRHPAVEAFVKNAGLGFAVPYLHNGQMHDYVPDFIIRLKADPPVHLILETKGFDPLEEVKRAAAERWVAAVNADGTYGRWKFALVKRVSEINEILTQAAHTLSFMDAPISKAD